MWIQSRAAGPRITRLMTMAAVVMLAGAAGSAGIAPAPQGGVTATTPRRGGNPEAAKIQNPVKPTPESVASGRATYQRLCSRCHGVQGKGDGGGAGAGGQPADLTDAEWDFGGSDGEIFSAIHDGTSADMEPYAERIPDSEIWNLVNFIRSIGPQNGGRP